ncbi:MAG: hypothetical protein KatS3mg032_2093 [Cyclobacteriaceae bacterium]|nr:MAG: hypothetical protein KatS3mg032_2093 [Cyclobacteriaceae bacterium]
MPVNRVSQFVSINNETWLISYNQKMHSLQFYNINERSRKSIISLMSAGPSGVEQISGICFINFDSILLATTSPKRRLVLIDSQANLIDQWEISDTLKYNNILYDLYIYKNFELTFNRGKVTVSISPYLPPESPACYQYPYLVEYDLIKRRVTANYGQFPFESDKIYLYLELPKHKVTPYYDIVHFSGSHDLFCYDVYTKELKRVVRAKSKYLQKKFKTLDPKIIIDDLQEEEKIFYVTQGRYDQLLYDSFRELYYRIVKLPVDYRNLEGKPHWEPDFMYSIMILDAEFRYVNEIELPGRTYNPSLATVTRDGLLISLNNPANQGIDEDHIYFHVFKPTQTL